MTPDDATIRHARYIVERWPQLADVRRQIAADPDPLGAYCEAVTHVMRKIQIYWDAWQTHPDFARCSKEVPQKPADPVVMGWFRHDEPGLNKQTHSFIFTTMSDATSPATVKWAQRALGTFERVTPIPHDMRGISATHQTFLTFSLRGSNRAFYARQMLKSLLPRRFHPMISDVRKWHGKPKWIYLANNHPDWTTLSVQEKQRLRRTPSLQPAWYRNASKAQLWVTHTQYRHLLIKLANYIDPTTFYACASGAIHPDHVPMYVVHQTSFLDIIEEEQPNISLELS